jgi:hypothetical protein
MNEMYVLKPVFALLATLLLLCSLMVFPASAMGVSKAKSNSSLLPGVTSGSAFAGYLQTPASFAHASIGPLYPVSLGCALSSTSSEATAGLMGLSAFASSGAVDDKVTTTRTSASVTTQASSDVQGLNILAGLIIAGEVNAVANSTATTTSASSTNTSTFTGQVVAGRGFSRTPAPNTVINLPGLGSVILNEQVDPTNSANTTSISVTAIDVRVSLLNLLGLPVGTHILIGHAQTNFARTAILAAVAAQAYGLYVFSTSGSNFATIGPLAVASISCTGGSSMINSPDASVPVVGSTGAITDMSSGQITSAGANASSSSTVHGVNLLTHLIIAVTVMTTAQASSSGSSSASTTLTIAMINGTPISANLSPNTRINLPGLGYVVVNEQALVNTPTKVTAVVNAFDLYVTTANSFGLPVGVRIIVGHSDATVSTA